MSLIWEKKKLEEVCHKIFAGGDKPKDHFSNTKSNFFSIPVVSNGEKNNGISGYTNLPTVSQEAITVSARGTIGFTVHRKYPFVPIVRLIVLIPNQEHISCEYIYYYLKSIDIDRTGTSIPQLTVPMIKKYSIPTPPLPEQKKIVETLDKAFEKIDKAIANIERNIENAMELFKSYLQNIFENRGDDWEINLIKEVCELKSGTTISKKLERDKGDVIYTKVGDMNLPGNKVEITTSSRFVNFNEINLKQIIPKGAIIFPKRGGAIATNKKRKIIKPTIVDLNTMAIIPGNGIDKDYFFHWFQLFDLLSISNGANIPQINNYSFDSVYLPYPKSKEKQREIVLTLNMLTEQKKKLLFIYTQKKSGLKELKKSILEKAFKGELTSAA